jgi:hypothetical protein
MKPKRQDQTEKRRRLVEINLLSETKARSAAASKGCAGLISRFLGGAVLVLLLRLGLG